MYTGLEFEENLPSYNVAVVDQPPDYLGRSTEVVNDSSFIDACEMQRLRLLNSTRLNTLYYSPHEVRCDPNVVKKVVKVFDQLAYASSGLRGDPEVVSVAISRSWSALAYASFELQNDRDMVGAAVRKNGMALSYASPALQADPQLALEAIKTCERAIQLCSLTLQTDRKFVKRAQSLNHSVKKYATMHLREFGSVVEAMQFEKARTVTRFKEFADLQFTSPELRADKLYVEFMMKAAMKTLGKKSEDKALLLCSPALREDRNFILRLETFCNGRHTLSAAHPSLQKDREIVLKAVSNNGLALVHASPELQRDEEIVIAAVTQNYHALQMAPLDLLLSPPFLDRVLQLCPGIDHTLPKVFNFEFLRAAQIL